MAEFNNLSEMFLTLLHCILLRHHEGYNIICDIIQNPELHRVRTLFIKNPRFISYIIYSAQELVQAEMISITSSNQLGLPIEEMNPWQLKEFSLVAIDRAHKLEVPYTHSLLRASIDSYDYIISD